MKNVELRIGKREELENQRIIGHREHRVHRALAGLVFLSGFAYKVNFDANTCLRPPGSFTLPNYDLSQLLIVR
jgi:hypothetical protein